MTGGAMRGSGGSISAGRRAAQAPGVAVKRRMPGGGDRAADESRAAGTITGAVHNAYTAVLKYRARGFI